MRSRAVLTAMTATAVVVLLPATVRAQAAAAGSEPVQWMAIAAVVWFAADKIFDLLPGEQSTVVQTIRRILNQVFGKKPQ